MTSYHGVDVRATAENLQLLEDLRISCWGLNEVDDKTQIEFDVLADDVPMGYIYSWKEYRELDVFDIIDFHIGANSYRDSIRIKEYVQSKLREIR